MKLLELHPVFAPTVTQIGPVVAEPGTVAVSWMSEPGTKLALTPLNVTPDAPVNAVPVTVTEVPDGPDVGLNPVT